MKSLCQINQTIQWEWMGHNGFDSLSQLTHAHTCAFVARIYSGNRIRQAISARAFLDSLTHTRSQRMHHKIATLVLVLGSLRICSSSTAFTIFIALRPTVILTNGLDSIKWRSSHLLVLSCLRWNSFLPFVSITTNSFRPSIRCVQSPEYATDGRYVSADNFNTSHLLRFISGTSLVQWKRQTKTRSVFVPWQRYDERNHEKNIKIDQIYITRKRRKLLSPFGLRSSRLKGPSDCVCHVCARCKEGRKWFSFNRSLDTNQYMCSSTYICV